MAKRIEIHTTVFDTRAQVLKEKLMSEGFPLTSLRVADVYTIDKVFTSKQYKEIAALLSNPVAQIAYLEDMRVPNGFHWALEIGFLPGVTDNVATTAKEMIADYFATRFTQDEGVYTSRVVYISGKLSDDHIKRIGDSMHNPLIQRLSVKNVKTFRKDKGMGMSVPKVALLESQKAKEVYLSVSDTLLAEIGKRGIPNEDGSRRGPLALDLSAMKVIQKHFELLRRNPTDVELESIAQTWSEHCKHTIMNSPIDDISEGLFKKYIRGATQKIMQRPEKRTFCVSVFTDNSGAISFDKTYALTHKVETHNSPSALDPYGGAITGIVGVNRDCLGFGLGAKPIMNMYGFCVGLPNDKAILYRDKERTQPLLSPRRILDGVIAGVNTGSNCSGIPTPSGFLYFDERYKGKPLVFAGTVGLIPKQRQGKKMYSKKAKPGDYIVTIGGRVGLDGIHGATFSSEALNSGSPATAVQIGDPITQKKLSDAVVKEARDLGLFTSITDNGAGGLSCSVAEMAKESGGCDVTLEAVPLKYPGLSPWQIWISESQERMTLAVSPNKWKAFATLMKRRGVEATHIGTFTASGFCKVSYKGKIVMNLSMEFLHDGLPKKHLHTKSIQSTHATPAHAKNISETLMSLLSEPNIAGFSFVSSQYDYEVQGTSVLKPLQGKGQVNADAAVVRPVPSSNTGFAVSSALYPTYGDIDAYAMTAAAIDTAIRNCVATGADPGRIALLDNFCWTESGTPERLWQLKQSAKACFDIAVAYGAPFISGKDSMYNDFRGFDNKGKSIKVSIPPTILISAIGIVPDVQKTVSIDFKTPGDLLYMIGDVKNELGGSAYYAFLSAKHHRFAPGVRVPKVDTHLFLKQYERVANAIQHGLVSSSISVHRGGLGVAIAKSAIAGQLGVVVTLPTTKDAHVWLFSETQGRVLVSVAPHNQKMFEKILGSMATKIGVVSDNEEIYIQSGKEQWVKETVGRSTAAYRKTFQGY